MNNRFSTKKRTALDGRVWWCIWDNVRNNWSTFTMHGKYRTKRDAYIGARTLTLSDAAVIISGSLKRHLTA